VKLLAILGTSSRTSAVAKGEAEPAMFMSSEQPVLLGPRTQRRRFAKSAITRMFLAIFWLAVVRAG
jgi:hypothetical protein